MTSTATVSTRRASKAGDGKDLATRFFVFLFFCLPRFCRTPSKDGCDGKKSTLSPVVAPLRSSSVLFLSGLSSRNSQRVGGGGAALHSCLWQLKRARERRKTTTSESPNELAAAGHRLWENGSLCLFLAPPRRALDALVSFLRRSRGTVRSTLHSGVAKAQRSPPRHRHGAATSHALAANVFFDSLLFLFSLNLDLSLLLSQLL